MDDLEQQIRAWADATLAVAETDPPGDAPPPAPDAVGRRRWARPALAAAAVLAIVGVALVAARSGSDRVRTGPASPVTSTTTSRDHPIRYDVLHVGGSGDEPSGTIRAAYDADQLADLWHDLRSDAVAGGQKPGAVGPVPKVDFGRQVIIGFTLDRPSCSDELVGFEHVSGRAFITPVFNQGAADCRGGPMRPRYIVAVDWDGDRPTMVVELPPVEDADGKVQPGPRLWLNRLRPDPVTVDVETDIGEIHAGDQMDVNVGISNATGKPLLTTGCGQPFSLGLRRNGQLFAPGQAWCLQQFVIPTGSSVFKVTLMASRYGCTVDPAAAVPDRCREDGTMPDLDAGTYEIVLLSPRGFDAVPPRGTIDVVPRGS